MGDISRHRDIYLFTRDTVAPRLLTRARLTAGDLTYLELGNYLTDVSQFRDPVVYIFAKQRIWREKVLPKVEEALPSRTVTALVGALAVGAGEGIERMLSGTPGNVARRAGIGAGALAALLATLPADLVADLVGADAWIDALLGVPIDRSPLPPPGAGTPDALRREALKKRDEKHYGHLGQFFQHFIEGTTHLLFADDVPERSTGNWGRVAPIPVNRVSEIYEEFFTQYFPHEHSDQPSYIWDASKRPTHPNLYGPSRRQRNLVNGEVGVMNVVDTFYVGYLAEGLAKVEDEWRTLNRDDRAGRQRLLVRTGKLLHGVEDWFFHSNVVELVALRGFRPEQGETESDAAFLQRFVEDVAATRPEFAAADPVERRRLKRRLHRRLRYPTYDTGTRVESYGRLSTRPSTPSLRHAYPAFPSSADTAHTLLHALGSLETKATGSADELPPWLAAALEQKGFALPPALARSTRPLVMSLVVRELREWIPLILTLLNESERQRLVANVAPEHWPLAEGATPPPRTTDKTETELQQGRHVKALQPRETEDARTESNYEQFVRYLVERNYLNERGQQAMVTAFDVDRRSEELPTDAPGCGGFLLEFGLELQEKLDEGRTAVKKLNRRSDSVYGRASNNGAFNEIIGSHSLMSKDTLTSVPFFDDARVLASVASSSVFTILLQQVAAPRPDRRIAWDQVLHHLIRFPPRNGGWERRALAMFADTQQIPGFDDLPELARLAAASMMPVTAPPATANGRPSQTKRAALEERYNRLEIEVAKYRY